MSNPIPQVIDTGRRVARTVVQVALAFASFAPVYPLIVAAIKAPDGSNLALWLAASATWVATIAGVISRIMAIPTVNSLLEKVNLAGHSTTVLAQDSWTSFIPVQASGDHAAR
jgi:hypothetical protein